MYDDISEEEINSLEECLIEEYYDDGLLYNISKKAGGGDLISYHPNIENIKRKQSENGKKRWRNASEETKKQYRDRATGERNYMYGRTHSLEARKKISEALTGRVVSSEERERMSIRTKKRFQNPVEQQRARDTMINRYKNIDERVNTGKKTLEYNIQQRELGIFKSYEYSKHDEKYEFFFQGQYFIGIESCVLETGYSFSYIKKKLLSESELDMFNYFIFDPVVNIESTRSEETKLKMRASQLAIKTHNYFVYIPDNTTIRFSHVRDILIHFSDYELKESTIRNLIKSGDKWSPKKHIHKPLEGMVITSQKIT